jgi:hypothetical protein
MSLLREQINAKEQDKRKRVASRHIIVAEIFIPTRSSESLAQLFEDSIYEHGREGYDLDSWKVVATDLWR